VIQLVLDDSCRRGIFGGIKGNISGTATALKVYNSIFTDKAKFIKEFLSYFGPIKKNFF
jgi:hypothetical protein